MIAYEYGGNGRADASMPLMSMVAMFYNQARYAKATFGSMLAQTHGNTEIIVSDDCSSDGTGEALLEAARRYAGPHRVVVNLNGKNVGIGNNFALLTSLSHGVWQTSLGGDDIAEPNYLEKVLEYSGKHPGAVAIGCSATTIDESDRIVGKAYAVGKPVVYHRYGSGPFTWSLVPGDSVTVVPVTGCVATYSRRLLEAAPFPEDIMSEDAFLGLRAALVGDVLFVPDVFVRQRINSGSVMRSGKGSRSRKERQRFRRRMSAMTYTSLGAVLKEIPLLRPDADMRNFSEMRMKCARALLGSFAVADPFGENYMLYKEALREAMEESSVWSLLRDAGARGLFCPTVKLLAKGMFR